MPVTVLHIIPMDRYQVCTSGGTSNQHTWQYLCEWSQAFWKHAWTNFQYSHAGPSHQVLCTCASACPNHLCATTHCTSNYQCDSKPRCYGCLYTNICPPSHSWTHTSDPESQCGTPLIRPCLYSTQIPNPENMNEHYLATGTMITDLTLNILETYNVFD